jgi:ribosomal protein S18 acetylase RimI-like enzyme
VFIVGAFQLVRHFVNIRPARIPDEMPAVRGLFREYAAELDVDLCFQNFEAELACLAGAYSPPNGRLIVAEGENQLAGCVALRPHKPGVAELKRLYVRPAFRGHGLGRTLLERIVVEATAAGYEEAVFDTLPSMAIALRMYRDFGFVETEPYCFNPVPGALYFRKALTGDSL